MQTLTVFVLRLVEDYADDYMVWMVPGKINVAPCSQLSALRVVMIQHFKQRSQSTRVLLRVGSAWS